MSQPLPSTPPSAGTTDRARGGAERTPRLPRFADAAVTRTRLRLVGPTRSEAPLAPFVAVLIVLLVAGVAGLLAFNTSMQQDSFAATALQKKATALSARRQGLQIDLNNLQNPQTLATRAKGLGMVPPTGAAFIRLADGRILGNPQPAQPDQAMRIRPLPAAKPKVLAPAPEVIKVHHHPPRGTDRPVQSVTDDRKNRQQRSAPQ